MNKLEEAANAFADEHGFRVPYNVSGREITNDDYYDKVDLKASKDGFLAGAEWQKDNMWMDVEEDGYPPYDENCGAFEQEKYLLRYVSGSISPKISYRIGFLSNIYRFIGEIDWVKVTHWMPIPKFVK